MLKAALNSGKVSTSDQRAVLGKDGGSGVGGVDDRERANGPIFPRVVTSPFIGRYGSSLDPPLALTRAMVPDNEDMDSRPWAGALPLEQVRLGHKSV